MKPIRITSAFCVGLALGATSLPAIAGAQSGDDSADAAGIVDIVLDVSGAEGFDDDPLDYDLLREALVATGLAQAVADADDITVFAPNDRAFVRLARDLGFEGRDEQGAFAFLAAATGFVSAAEPGLLDDVLLYHVSPGAKTVRELRRQHPIETLLEGATVEVVGNRVIDNDPDDRDARIRRPRNLVAANGIIQTVNRVLRPIDLDPVAPPLPATVVDVVLEVSGSEGFDDDAADYDLLREALVATGLVTAVAEASDITVFAPTDAAFADLATDLGFAGGTEAEVFGFLAEATGFESADEPGILADVLLYHVAPGAQTAADLAAAGPIATLLADATVTVDGSTVVDADLNAPDASIIDPQDIATGNGIIQSVDRVLRPIDLPPTVPEEPVGPNIVDIVLDASGSEGFDRHFFDYDILREALVATNLVDAVANADDVTVFAPADIAFILLAIDLGYRNIDEQGVFEFLAEATGYVSPEEPGLLDDVLLYHVLPGAKTVAELNAAGALDTLLGTQLEVRYRRVIDGDRNDRDAYIYRPSDIEASNGIVHTVYGVLRPIDL